MKLILALMLLSAASCRPPSTAPSIPAPRATVAPEFAHRVQWLEEAHGGPGDGDNAGMPPPVALEARMEGVRLVFVATFATDVPHLTIYTMGLRGAQGSVWFTARDDTIPYPYDTPGVELRVKGRRVELSGPAVVDFAPEAIALIMVGYSGFYHQDGWDYYLDACRWPRA